MPPSATVAIVTRNRRDDLRRALASVLEQTVHCELLVMDDGSEDGTAEMVAAEFPSARVHSSERVGLLAQRNRAFAAAGTDVVFMLDDDALFSTPHVVAQTLPLFDDPQVAAVSIPHLDLLDGELQWRVEPAAGVGPYAVSTFVGCSHALRRSAYLEVEGYREWMPVYGEESELALRLLDRGYVVLLGASDPVHHLRSPLNRSKYNEMRSRTQNTIVTALMYTPAAALPGHLLLLLAYVPFDIARTGYARAFAAGVLAGFREGWRLRRRRSPVSAATFRLSERLRREGPLELAVARATAGWYPAGRTAGS